jgi:hypothetical protein
VSSKVYKETVAELNESRTNRVFKFFKITAPERVGFAKHREAAKRKAAVLAAADADAGETATSPRAAPTRKTSRKNAPPLPPSPPPKEEPGRNVVAGRRTHPQRPREPGLWTSRLAS